MPLTTRRQFLSHSLMGFSATVFSSTFPWEAFAEEMPVTGLDFPFLIFDCAGGAAFPANFLVTGEGGRPLSDYSRLGFDGRREESLDRSFGLPMAASQSSILKGMKAAASREALANLRMGSFCHFSLDDQGNNAFSSVSLAYSASRKGSALNAVLGTNASTSGGNSTGPVLELMPRPTQITKIEDLSGSVGFGAGSSLQSHSKERLRQYAQVLKKLNRRITGAQVENRVYDEIQQQIENSPSVDPRGDQLVAQVYGLNSNSASTSPDAISATVVKSVVQGLSGPGVLTIGGCDYHDRGVAVTEAKDLEIGTAIGRAVEVAHRLKRPLFFQLLTDGGVGAEPNSRIWRGDDGSKCMTVIGCYHPEKAIEFVNRGHFQVGHFTDGQGADRNTLFGDSSGKQAENLAYGVIANYYNAAGRLSEFEKLYPQRFTSDQLKTTLLMG